MAWAIFPGRQKYENCGVQSAQQIIYLATGKKLDETALLQDAIKKGNANPGPNPPDLKLAGGTQADQRQRILKDHGVASSIQPTTRANLEQAIKDGKGVIVNVDAGVLYNAARHLGKGHTVTVTGGTFDDNGHLTTVNLNDTGSGIQRTVSADAFIKAADAKKGGSDMNVTDHKIWP